ncbi:MAG: TetR/AcrR family transcriptional regulator [Phycisphaerae bacterium]|nr:TetR/AcrR family transcriptional regulator [Phycisphaerae bacterium]
MPSQTRKQREREAHRREILAAAERVFVRKGYYAATVEEIAAEAEFAVGTLYNFFDGKKALYHAAVSEIIGQLYADARRRALGLDDPEQAVGALIELELEYAERHRGFLRVTLEMAPGGELDPAEGLPDEAQRVIDQYRQDVIEVFRRGVERGVFDALDPFYLALCLEGIVKAFITYWSRHEPDEPLAVRCEKLKQTFIGRIKLRQTGPAAEAEPRVDRGQGGQS